LHNNFSGTFKAYSLARTTEELDDVREVHVVVQDDVTVRLDRGQCSEEREMTRGHVTGGPDHLPHARNVGVDQL